MFTNVKQVRRYNSCTTLDRLLIYSFKSRKTKLFVYIFNNQNVFYSENSDILLYFAYLMVHFVNKI